MRQRPELLTLMALLLAGSAYAAAPAAGPAKLKVVTLHVFNRVFANFHDKVQALPNREFRIGDTEYTGRVIEFVPDFSMDLKSHKIITRSGEPKNPAFHVVVYKSGVPQDTSWAFFNMPPHYGTRDVLAFVATDIQFVNRPPLVSGDSLALRIRSHEGSAR